jgi:hypothetical protein
MAALTIIVFACLRIGEWRVNLLSCVGVSPFARVTFSFVCLLQASTC